MRAFLLTTVVAAGCLLIAAPAQADKIDPKSARKQSVELVPAYNKCTSPGLTHHPILTLPSCPPVRSSTDSPANDFTFAANGTASALFVTAKNDVRVVLKSRGILRNGLPYTGADIKLTADLRATDNGCGAGADVDCTVTDSSIEVDLTCLNGSCGGKFTAINAADPGIHPGDAANLEIGQVTILDPDGDAFLRSGLLIVGPNKLPGAPKQARKYSVEMVTAYNKCTAPTLTHRSPLAQPACAPQRSSANDPTNDYTFGTKNGKPDGSASMVLQSVKKNVKLSARSKSVWRNGAPYSGTGLLGIVTVRMTDNGCGPSPYDVDCTIVDFPIPLMLGCVNGSCVPSSVTPQAILPSAFDDQANLELGPSAIVDQDGDTFAKSGFFLR